MPDLPVNNEIAECSLAFDMDAQKFLFIDPCVVNVLGITAAAFYKDPGLLTDLAGGTGAGKAQALNGRPPGGGRTETEYRVTVNSRPKWVRHKQEIIADEQSGHLVALSTIQVIPAKNDPALNDSAQSAANADVKLNEQFLASLIDSQTNFMIRLDSHGRFTFANKQFLKTLGYRKAELTGKHFSITVPPEDLPKCEKAFYDCINHPGKVIRLAHKKIDKAGNIYDTEWEFISIRNDEGTVTAIQGIGQDVSHKVSIEKEIKRTAEKLESFIESITDSFFIVDKNWRFVKVNTAFEKICQKPRSEILGNLIWEIFPRIINTRFEEGYRKAADENVEVTFTEYFEPFGMWFSTTVYPSAEGLTVFIKNISEEVHAREELMWTKNSLEALINNTQDQIWSLDKETRYVYMNKAYRSKIAELTGVEPNEGEYSYLHAGYDQDIISRWKQYYRRALSGEIYTVINESVDPATQQVISFEISFNPIFKAGGEITGVGCFAHNITQRLRAEKAIVAQNERLRNIASLSSHELRRPVASMLGLINVMDRGNFFNPDNKEIIGHLLTVGREIDEVIRLIVDKTFTEYL